MFSCRLSLSVPMSLHNLTSVRTFIRREKKTPGKGLNKHQSKKAKEGLYHGADVRFGHSISHSHTKSKRRWTPNVQNKRVWSDALDSWVRFKMTVRAMKAIDNYGGIDNYILKLDEKSVTNSKSVSRERLRIATALFHKGRLDGKLIKRLGFDKVPPAPLLPKGQKYPPAPVPEKKGPSSREIYLARCLEVAKVEKARKKAERAARREVWEKENGKPYPLKYEPTIKSLL